MKKPQFPLIFFLHKYPAVDDARRQPLAAMRAETSLPAALFVFFGLYWGKHATRAKDGKAECGRTYVVRLSDEG